MRRMFLTIVAMAALMVVATGPVFAADGGKDRKACKAAGKTYSAGKKKDKCQKKDRGQPPKNSCHDGKDNDYDGKADMADEECQNPDDGDENGDDNAPAGNCSKADLVLLTQDVKILCLYFGDNAMNATTAKDCPDALLALPVDSLVGACLFLPPADSGSTTAATPTLQSALSALPSLPLSKLPLLGS